MFREFLLIHGAVNFTFGQFSLNIAKHSLHTLRFLKPVILKYQHPSTALALHDPEYKP